MSNITVCILSEGSAHWFSKVIMIKVVKHLVELYLALNEQNSFANCEEDKYFTAIINRSLKVNVKLFSTGLIK